MRSKRLVVCAAVVLMIGASALGQREQQKTSAFDQKVMHLAHTDARDMAKLLQAFLGEGRAAWDERTNSVVISAPQREIEMALRLVDALDVPAETTSESSAIIRIADSAPPDLLNLINTLVSGRTRASFDRQTGMLVLRGASGDIDQVRELIEQLPSRPGTTGEAPLTISFYFIQALLAPEDRPDARPQESGLYTPDPRNAAVAAKLEAAIPMDVSRAPLADVIQQLADAADVDVVVNWAALESIGLEGDQLITLKLREPAPLSSLLELVFEQLGAQDELGYDVRHGIVRVALREQLNRDTYVEVCNVHELVKSVPRFALEMMSSSVAPPAPGAGVGGFGGGGTGTQSSSTGSGRETVEPGRPPAVHYIAPVMWDERDDEPAEQLMEIIRITVTPDDWLENGGDVASMHHAGGMLVVKHNARGHQAIVELLELLRKRHIATRRAVSRIEVPAALAPVMETLAEHGFNNAALLAPLKVTVGRSGVFELEGSAAQFDRMLAVRVEGEARSAGDGAVELRVRASIGPKVALPGTLGGPEPMFRLASTVTAPLGDYIVLATSPGATDYGQAVALVVRVDAAK